MDNSNAIARWHIIGNGDGMYELQENERVIRFNQSESSDITADLVISNCYDQHNHKGMRTTGIEPYPGFATVLLEQAQQLEQALGVWPSLGLTTLFALKDWPTTLRLSCMNLLPSIARPKSLSERKPLPCSYHNWLGERRLAMGLSGNLDWPAFWLPQENLQPPTSSDPYPRLLALAQSGKMEGAELIRQLVSESQGCWNGYATKEKLKNAESIFFLERGEHNTNNWWLYHFEASHLMTNIRQKLALAQQNLYRFSPIPA